MIDAELQAVNDVVNDASHLIRDRIIGLGATKNWDYLVVAVPNTNRESSAMPLATSVPHWHIAGLLDYLKRAIAECEASGLIVDQTMSEAKPS